MSLLSGFNQEVEELTADAGKVSSALLAAGVSGEIIKP